MKTYTSRFRSDPLRRYTGVFQQMGRPVLDADWNEQVDVGRTELRDRAGDLAEGSPDDGFRITDRFLLDPPGRQGWAGQGLPDTDERVLPRELILDRRDPAGLPRVLRTTGHIAVRRTLATPLDLDAAVGGFPIARLVTFLKFDRPPADDELVEVRLWLRDAAGVERTFPSGLGVLEKRWTRVAVDVTSPGLDRRAIVGWGFVGLPPRARLWVDALYGESDTLDAGDLVIGGGDGTRLGAGRIWVDGHRAWLARDVRYLDQPDLPGATPLPTPAAGRAHFVYLDLWERAATWVDDPDLLEPAMEGMDTTTRLTVVQQVRVRTNVQIGDVELPSPTGNGRLTTNVPLGVPERFPVQASDPCRDRCLFTETASLGEGYRGTEHLHVRVEVLRGGPQPIIGWARDNAATLMPIVEDLGDGAQRVIVNPGDAARLVPGDVVVIEDEQTRRHPDGPHPPVLRRIRSVEAATGTVRFDDPGSLLATDPAPLDVGGVLPWAPSRAFKAAIRRWDGADWFVPDVCYNLRDGLRFRISGTDLRTLEYWAFTVRVHAADGTSRGVVEQLTDAPVRGPIHHLAPLGRIRMDGGRRVFEDLRRRWLPLADVRDRLVELEAEDLGKGPFTVVVGDGVVSHGDVDQDLAEGVTGDEALQEALRQLRLRIDGQTAPADAGGTIFVRRGRYVLEHPVLVEALSHVRIVGEGDATELTVTGAGGAFYLDRCDDVRIERVRMIESPSSATRIGRELSEVTVPPLRVLGPADVTPTPIGPDLVDDVADRLRILPPDGGRAADLVIATLRQLRLLQRRFPGQVLEDVPEAQPLLESLMRLPHGVVTVSDSRAVNVTDAALIAKAPAPGGIGVMLTGSCVDLVLSELRIEARTGVSGVPYASFLTATALRTAPRAGLYAEGLQVRACRMIGRDGPLAGVYVAEGAFRAVVVERSRIDGYPVGVALLHRTELRIAGSERSRVLGNEIRGASLAAVQVSADHVDVEGNDIVCGAARGPFLAGICVAGSDLRVRQNRITLVVSPVHRFGVRAGVLVGDGLDDGTAGRVVSGVEIAANEIGGSGATSQDTGILVGGPQPIHDVRIAANTVRNLGDAGIRVLGTGPVLGVLRIDENTVEDTALARLGDGGVSREEVLSALAALDPRVAGELASEAAAVDLSVGGSLLTAITGRSGTVRVALDAALRRVEAQTVRGGIVVVRAERLDIWGNVVRGVGTTTGGPTDSETRTAAIAVLGCTDVEVSENRVDQTVAPVVRLPTVPPIVRLPPVRGLLAPVDDLTADAGDLAAKRLAGLGAYLVRRIDTSATSDEVGQYGARLALAAASAAVPAATAAGAKASVDANASHLVDRSAGADPAGAIHVLTRDLGTLVDEAGIASTGLAATGVLLKTLNRAVEPGIADPVGEAHKVLDTAEAVRLLAPSIREGLKATTSKGDLITSIRGRLEEVAAVGHLDLADAVVLSPRGRFSPAHGLFAAGCLGTVRIASNTFANQVNGITVTGGTTHALAGGVVLGVDLDVLDNHVRAAVLTGIEAVLDGISHLTLAQNQVDGSMGEGGSSFAGGPQAAIRVKGTGQLTVQGNRTQANGNEVSGAIAHEVHLDWRGDVAVVGNVLRHRGGGEGGAALVLILEAPRTADLVDKLCRAPFLTVEPAKSTPKPAQTPADAPTHDVVLGSFKQILPRSDALTRALRIPANVRPAPARPFVFDRVDTSRGLLDFVRTPIRLPTFSAAPTWRSIHVEGNDLSSPGPALLAIGEGADVLSTTVTGNSMRSDGTTGAVYLRHTDATVFTGNRCQSGNAVNVVLIVADDAPVSASANVVLGQEPVAQAPRPERPSSVTFGVPLANGTTISVPLRPAELADVLDIVRQPLIQVPPASTPPEGQPPAGPVFALPMRETKMKVMPAASPKTGVSGLLASKQVKAVDSFSHLVASGIATAAGGTVVTTGPSTPSTPVSPADLQAGTLSALLDRIQTPLIVVPIPGSNAPRYSLVLIGGTKVAAIANATTAGVLVIGANGVVELNP